MAGLIRLTEHHIQHTMRQGELPEEVTHSAPKVAVILTQDWCPEWHIMRDYLKNLQQEDLLVYVSMYNRESYFSEFMHFKEHNFANTLIPYVRYYTGGIFRSDSNFLNKEVFLRRFPKD